MKTTVIYHSADMDGVFCREIARKFLPDAELIGWNFGDDPLQFDTGALYVMDLPCDRPFGFNFADVALSKRTFANKDGIRLRDVTTRELIWLDHHASSIESHPTNIPGYRIDGVAACRLAWQWFTSAAKSWKEGDGANPPNPNGGFYVLPDRQDFIDRNVSEPLAVRLAGEYDIWDKRDPDAETFQHGLRTESPNFELLLDEDSGPADNETMRLVEAGKISQRYAQSVDASICKSRTWLMDWEGLKFLCVNSARFNSLLFAAKDAPETGHDALLGFCFDGKCWTVSLYHAKHRMDLDLSEIAKKYGGGGHKGAAGMTFRELPPFLH